MTEGLSALVQAFAHPAATPLIVLAGEPGSGRSALVNAALARLGETDAAPGLLRLDLEGFESEGDLVAFARFQNRKKAGWTPGPSTSAPATSWNAALLSLGFAPGPGTGREAFLEVLRKLTGERPRILHLPDPCLIPDPLLTAILAESATDPRLIVVLSCRRWELRERALPDLPADTVLVDVEAPSTAELRASVEAGLGAGAWGLLRGIAANPLSGPAAGAFPRFLVLAGLCRDTVPADLLLEALGLWGEAQDAILDYLDQTFVEQGLLEDLEYSHPSFPHHASYRFASPLAARASREGASSMDRSRLGDEIFAVLRQRLLGDGRGTRRMLLEMADGLGRHERARLLRELAWWTAAAEAPDLTTSLGDALTAGCLDAESLWITIEDTGEAWTGARRLALLDAYAGQPGGSPAWRSTELRAARAAALANLRRWDEAQMEALAALSQLDPGKNGEARLAACCHAVAGLALAERGDFEVARSHLAAVAGAAIAGGPEPGPESAKTSRSITAALRELRPDSLVTQGLEEALAISQRLLGFEARRAADLWETFSDLFRRGGHLEPARLSLERALEISRRFAGLADFQLAIAFKNLADLDRELGDRPAACRALEEALAIETSLYGMDDDQVDTLRNTLFDLLLELGDLEAARHHLTASLETRRRTRGEKSPEALVLLKHLADLSRRLGDRKGIVDALAEVLTIEEEISGPLDPRLIIPLKQLADLHRDLGERDRMATCRVRVLRIEEALYGAEDPRLLMNLKLLATLSQELGDETACNFLERARLIESHQARA